MNKMYSVLVPIVFSFSVNALATQNSAQTFNQTNNKTVMIIDGTSDDFISGGKTKLFTNLSMRPVYYFNGISYGVQFSMPGDLTAIDATFTAPVDTTLTKGVYNYAERYPFQSKNNPGISISGDGRGCNTIKGKFIVRDVHYNASGELQDIAIDFIQHCEGRSSYLTGALRYNSNLPINFNITD